MLVNPEVVFHRYLSGKIVSLKKIDTSRQETDKRFTYVIDTDAEEHIVIKFSNNCFTTPERVKAWSELIEQYNRLGIYAPKIIRDKYGCISNPYIENGNHYIAYAEEKKKYKTTDEMGIAPSDNTLYFEDMVKAAAKVAKHVTRLPGWKSAWCIYDKFCIEDEADETYYWQYAFYKLVIEEMPVFRERAERIWKRFLAAYQSFEAEYRALPQAFFQGDEGGLNTLLDESKSYVGTLDFNLAGAEVVMNYFFKEFCRVPIKRNEVCRLNDRAFRDGKDMKMRARIDTVKKYYTFSTAEKAAFPTYYKIAYPLECDICQTFQGVIRDKNLEEVALALDWIEYQQTRNDIFL